MSVSVERRFADLRRYFDEHPGVVKLIPIAWVLLIGGIVFLWDLGNTGLVDETEPLFAEAARQMDVTGDWITPYFNGETRFDKPPLIYWLMAIAYQVIGVNEWAARLPSALSAIALMGMGFYTLQRYGISSADTDASKQRWLSAYIGSALIALHPLTIAWARTGVSDMLLTGCIGLALLTFFCGYATARKSFEVSGLSSESRHATQLPFLKGLPSPWYLASYVFTALAILTKGPVGIVLPGLIVAAFLLYVGNWRTVLQEMRPLVGVGIILAITLPWYILVTLANGEAFIDSFFGYHNVERFTSVVNRHWAPWYFYFVVVLVGFAPWSLYLPSAIARLHFWKRSIWQHQPRSSQLGLFAFFWFACIFGFFTIAVTKLPSYVLPLMPAAAILVSLFWSGLLAQPGLTSWGAKVSAILNALLFLGIGAVLFHAPDLVKGDRAMPALSPLLRTSGLPVLGAAIAVLIAAVISVLLIRRQVRWIWLANTVGLLILIAIVLLPAAKIVDSQRQLPLRQLAQTIVHERKPGEELVMIGVKKPSVVFYTQQPVTFKLRSKTAANHLREEATTQPETQTSLILSSPINLEQTGLKPEQYQTLQRSGAYQLVRVSNQTLAQLPTQE